MLALLLFDDHLLDALFAPLEGLGGGAGLALPLCFDLFQRRGALFLLDDGGGDEVLEFVVALVLGNGGVSETILLLLESIG